MVLVMILVMLTYILTFYDLNKLYKSVSENSRRAGFLGLITFIVPLISFFYQDTKSKFSLLGAVTILLSATGLFITLFSTHDFIQVKPQRTVLSIVMTAVMLLAYMSSWYIHYDEKHKLAFVGWLIMATLMILTKEDIIVSKKTIIKEKDLHPDTLFTILSILTLVTTSAMFFYPIKPQFDIYFDVLSAVSILVGVVIFGLRQIKKAGYAEFIWIWLLSFINIATIDGYIRYAQIAKILERDDGIISASIINLPIFINAILAFYTSYRGVSRKSRLNVANQNKQEIGMSNMILMTFFTVIATIFGLLFNSGDLYEKTFEEVLTKMYAQRD